MSARSNAATRPHRRTSATGRERVAALDGFRAIGLLLIVGFHFGVSGMPGGFVGVDVFYVLSGYLITGLLLGEWARTARIALGAFWLRRARRLLPALLVVLVVVTLVVRFTYPAGLYPDLRMDDLSALFYFSNWWQIASSGNYFVATGAVSPLTHTWSLAVEEQFYLVYPALFILVALVGSRWPVRTKLAVFLGLVVVASYLWSGIASGGSILAPGSALTRAWELAVGGLLALGTPLCKRLPGALAAVLTWAGLGALVALVVGLPTTLAYPGWVAALPVTATALIIGGGAAVPSNGAESLLRLPPFKWLGRWSYSIYLWHLPVILLGIRYFGSDATWTRVGLAGLAVVISAGTYFGFENPIRHSRLLTRRPPLSVGMGLITIAACLGVVTLIA